MVCVRGALALVHPLVQVYTIPKTGQLSYGGHVGNFHEKVSEFLSSLPTLPCNMPYVKVRPRNFAGKPSQKAPYTVNVQKLRSAFEWLQKSEVGGENTSEAEVPYRESKPSAHAHATHDTTDQSGAISSGG